MDPERKSSGDELTATVSQALDFMWNKFREDILERARVLEDAAQAAAASKLRREERAAAQAAAHKLAGTLGTFGLERGTKLARDLENLYSSGNVADAGFARRAGALAKEIRAIIESRK